MRLKKNYIFDLFFKQQKSKLKSLAETSMENSIAHFIKKTYQILQNPQLISIIHWLPSGKEFIIKDIDQFQREVLPSYFRHRNIHSFIRQLNMYDFHKSRKDPSKNIFSHRHFQKGREDLLHLVKRKVKQSEKNQENKPQVQSFPTILKEKILKEETERSILAEKSENWMQPELKKKDSSKEQQKSSQNCINQLSLQSMICPSSVLNGNPQIYSNLHDNRNDQNFLQSQEDNLSIQGQIQKERTVFMNRRSGVSLVRTHNLLQTQNNLSNPDI